MSRIVELSDTEPLMIDPAEMTEPVWICRCGLSADWPYCDSSHNQARKESAGKRYVYRRETARGPLLASESSGDELDANPRPREG